MDYPALETVMRLERIAAKKQQNLFHQVQDFEYGAVTEFKKGPKDR